MEDLVMSKKYKPYIVSLLFTFGIALLSNYLVGASSVLYDSLIKPMLSPPANIFGIVWPILYTLMGIAAALIYTTSCNNDTCLSNKKSALRLYIVQLIFNGIWPILLFQFEMFTLSFIWIMILWVLILKMFFDFYKINKDAGYMIIPYLLWVTFAAYLNFMIAILN